MTDENLLEISTPFFSSRRDCLALMAAAVMGGRSLFGAVTKTDRDWAAQTLAKLSLAERVGQLMSVHHGIQGLEEGLRRGKAGSMQVVRGGKTTAKDVVDSINELQAWSPQPLLMMGAVEAGMGQVAREATLLPNNMAIGATDSAELAYAAANITAKEAKALGIDWPGVTVADVNSNPLNPIINTRSFGDDPQRVSRLLVASIKGVRAERLISTANHFPGHGGTSQDSHLELPTVNRSREELARLDLPSFRAAIQAQVATMCTAHICYPALEPNPELPATMSSAILTKLLREELGFQGFIHSDSFAMEAIRKHFTIADAAVQSVRAGCDILLSYPDWETCFQAVRKAAEDDPQFRRRVDESASRILAWKHWVGLPQRHKIVLDNCLAVLGNPRHQQTAREIARAALTAVRGEAFLKSVSQRERVVCLIGRQRKPLESPPADQVLSDLLAKFWPQATRLDLDVEPSADQLRAMTEQTKSADAAVYLGLTQVRNHDPDSVRFPKPQADAVRYLTRRIPTAVISFGSPYAVDDFPEAQAVACAYDKIPVCLEAGIEALLGKIPWPGKLPVQLS